MQLYASNVFHYSAIGFSSFAYNVHPSQTFSFISFVERSSRSMDQDPGPDISGARASVSWHPVSA